MICSTLNNVCHKCKQKAKFFDNTYGKWYCGINIYARGICYKNRTLETHD